VGSKWGGRGGGVEAWTGGSADGRECMGGRVEGEEVRGSMEGVREKVRG
jgi:hypothetical protein